MPPTTTKKPEYVMPRPPAIVAWKNAPGVPDSYAVVTAYGKNAVGVMVFPPESRVGVPKDNVRFVDDPRNVASGINPDSGVWDYTDESKAIRVLADALMSQSGQKMLATEDAARVLGRLIAQ